MRFNYSAEAKYNIKRGIPDIRFTDPKSASGYFKGPYQLYGSWNWKENTSQTDKTVTHNLTLARAGDVPTDALQDSHSVYVVKHGLAGTNKVVLAPPIGTTNTFAAHFRIEGPLSWTEARENYNKGDVLAYATTNNITACNNYTEIEEKRAQYNITEISYGKKIKEMEQLHKHVNSDKFKIILSNKTQLNLQNRVRAFYNSQTRTETYPVHFPGKVILSMLFSNDDRLSYYFEERKKLAKNKEGSSAQIPTFIHSTDAQKQSPEPKNTLMCVLVEAIQKSKNKPDESVENFINSWLEAPAESICTNTALSTKESECLFAEEYSDRKVPSPTVTKQTCSSTNECDQQQNERCFRFKCIRHEGMQGSDFIRRITENPTEILHIRRDFMKRMREAQAENQKMMAEKRRREASKGKKARNMLGAALIENKSSLEWVLKQFDKAKVKKPSKMAGKANKAVVTKLVTSVVNQEDEKNREDQNLRLAFIAKLRYNHSSYKDITGDAQEKFNELVHRLPEKIQDICKVFITAMKDSRAEKDNIKLNYFKFYLKTAIKTAIDESIRKSQGTGNAPM